MPGPMPRREDALARPRSRKGSDQQSVTKGVMRPVDFCMDANENWHRIARQLWDACVSSGQSDFYQNSDYALLYSICDDLSLYKMSGKQSGQMLMTIYSAMERLLVAEGDRRRVRIELHAPEPEQKPASVHAIEDMRRRLGG
jgi:hypothetical protein